MTQDKIVVRGAREHNLKNISLEIPRDKLVVITGLSGSGKSSLAFDTIFAEGQRRYVESLSAYARQFLGQMEKPDVDQIEGLSPAVSIDQRSTSRNPRSTVGTVTEIYDYLRLLYARVGTPHCPTCGRQVQQQTPEQIIDAVLALPAETRLQVLAPLIKDRKGHHQQVFEDVRKAGFVRVRVDGTIYDVNEEIELDRYKNHIIEAVIDRLIIPSGENGKQAALRPRLADSVETALRLGDGMVIINDLTRDPPRDLVYSERFACPQCGVSLPEFEPRTFSFNTPHGACSACQGLGIRLDFDPALIISNPDLSLEDGAVTAWGPTATSENGYYGQVLRALAEHYHIPLDVPIRQLNKAQLDLILYGTGDERIQVDYFGRDGRRASFNSSFEGVIPNLKRRYQETTSDTMRAWIENFMSGRPCETCGGKRLRPEALAVTIGNKNIIEVTASPVSQTLAWVKQLSNQRASNGNHKKATEDTPIPPLTERQLTIARQILKEICARLQFMVDVGLDYLTLDRSAATLSGGEAQRIRLATQIGSRLMGVLYVLDEPSIGLHQRDQARLIKTLQNMRDLGNTLLVVEHDNDTILAADWVIDLGPGAGVHGGEVVFEGPVDKLYKDKKSLTGAYLSGRKAIPVPQQHRPGNGQALSIRGATENNLKNVNVNLPLGKFVCVTGVSGSGKSTLVVEVLYKRLAQLLQGSKERAGAHEDLEGVEENLDKVINVDQSPIGRTPRSNPATYTGFFGDIRDLFAGLPESKVHGYGPGRFSFNVRGGRCEACEGQGQIQIEMQFLPDIFVTCDVCHGARYNRETLQMLYKGKNIAEVLAMTVSEAVEFFTHIPKIKRKLKTLADVGLSYITLGQAATTLSGGEAQRVKLSKELSRRDTGKTLYVLDEPSVGLHAADVHKLIEVLNRLVDAGNTVVIIEHHPDIIKVADWIIDLGPEGGNAGGQIVAEGTPQDIIQVKASYTGQYLKPYLEPSPPA